MKNIKLKNTEWEYRLNRLKPLLKQRGIVGYVAARNTRIIGDALTEYFDFRHELIKKYGQADIGPDGKDLGTISVRPDSRRFDDFMHELKPIGEVENEICIMTLSYQDAMGELSGEEILDNDWMLIENDENKEENQNG